jgi:hypothetical protein
MLPCLHCGRSCFSIVGRCEVCAPGLHAAYRKFQDFDRALEARYRAETGQPSLQDWDAYENWLIRQPDAPAYAEALNELQRLEQDAKALRLLVH